MQNYKFMTVLQLEAIAKERKIKGYSRMKKSRLVTVLNKWDKQALEIPKVEPVKKLGRPQAVTLITSEFTEPKNINPVIDRLIKEVQNRGLSLNKTIFVNNKR